MKKRSGCMLAYPFEEKRLASYTKPYIVQPKLDGNRCRLLIENGYASLLSSTEELITGVPHLLDYFQRLAEANPDHYCEMDGELYRHGWDQGKINGIVSRLPANVSDEHGEIEFHVFDSVIPGREQGFRLEYVNQFITFVDWDKVKQVEFNLAYNISEVIEYYNSYIEKGFEGIIVRNLNNIYKRSRSTQMMKFKEKKKDSYEITRVNEAISEDGTHLNMVGSFTCVDRYGNSFNVGAGKLKHNARRSYWDERDNIIGLYCTVGYQNLTAKEKVPRHGMCVRITVTKESFEEAQ